jgi:hypothetical protein
VVVGLAAGIFMLPGPIKLGRVWLAGAVMFAVRFANRGDERQTVIWVDLVTVSKPAVTGPRRHQIVRRRKIILIGPAYLVGGLDKVMDSCRLLKMLSLQSMQVKLQPLWSGR